MDTHFSILTWKIPWTEKPGRLEFMGPQRVGRDSIIQCWFFSSFPVGPYKLHVERGSACLGSGLSLCL